MKNKFIFIILFIPLMLLSKEFQLKDKKVGIVSNVGNIFVVFNWNDMLPIRHYMDFSKAKLDDYISNELAVE